jgi:FkbM family methyltransferase
MPAQSEFLQLCHSLFDPPIVMLDIGAEAGITDLPHLAPLCAVHAFEPRPESYERLIRGGQRRRYGRIKFHCCGLAGTPGRKTLHVTADNGAASSLLPPNPDVIRRCWDERFGRGFRQLREEEIDCTTLDEFADRERIGQVDFLKLDTQGTELDILLGGEKLLSRVLVIRSEVEFVELYRGQKLFDDMVRELSTRGFRFVDFPGCATFNRKGIWADVIFARYHLDRAQLVRAALVLSDLECWGDALWMLQDAGIGERAIQRLQAAFGVPPEHLARTLRNFLRLIGGRQGSTPSFQNVRKFLAGVLPP